MPCDENKTNSSLGYTYLYFTQKYKRHYIKIKSYKLSL